MIFWFIYIFGFGVIIGILAEEMRLSGGLLNQEWFDISAGLVAAALWPLGILGLLFAFFCELCGSIYEWWRS